MKEKFELVNLLAEGLNEFELNSEIRKRGNTEEDVWFFLVEDSKEDFEPLLQWLFIKEISLKRIYVEKNMSDPTDMIDYIMDGSWGYSDEYAICEYCEKIFKKPDYEYNHECEIVECDAEIVWLCDGCIKKNQDTYLEDKINNPKKCVTMFSKEEMESIGWKSISSHETGLYDRFDDPEEIFKKIQNCDEYKNCNFIFVRTDQNPFEIEYDLMFKERNDD